MPELVEWLYEIGPMSYTAMGVSPIGWSDIQSWQSVTGLALEPHEAQAIKNLSLAYVDQHERSKEANCPCPWFDPTNVNRESVSDKIKDQFRAFSERRKKQRGRRSQTTS